MHIPFAGGLPFFYVSDILLGPIQYLILSEVLFVTFAVRVPGVWGDGEADVTKH